MSTEPNTGPAPAAEPDPPAAPDRQDFLSFLANVAPDSVEELTEALAEVLAAVRDTGKAGSLTYTLTLKRPKGGTDKTMVTPADSITTKIPKTDREPLGTFWIHGESLSAYPPGQRAMFDVERAHNNGRA